jgi:hypothetical protein
MELLLTFFYIKNAFYIIAHDHYDTLKRFRLICHLDDLRKQTRYLFYYSLHLSICLFLPWYIFSYSYFSEHIFHTSHIGLDLQSSGGSGKDNIGDILDDFVRQRFGQGSYERVDEHVLPSRKQSALKFFNNHQEGRFVFLLETRACSSSIKLSSVDTVIIFASDWNPMTDIRSLQKITLHSQFDQINIFRLYSSCTVEEKVLIIARQDKTLESSLHSISRAASDMLLMWGASYLFEKLSEFHCGNDTASSGNTLFEQSHLKDVIQEFLTIIIQKGKDNTPSNSIILKVKQNQGIYTTNFPLHGERKIQLLDEELPHIFWKKLLEGKQPRWKYSSGLSQRNRKRVQYADDIQKNTVVEGDEVVKKRNKVANNSTNSPSLKAALIGKWLISLLINCFDLFLILYMQMVPLSEYRVAIIVGFP